MATYKYKDIILRILDNVGIEEENSKIIHSIKRSIEDILNEVFTVSEAPIKTSYYKTTELTKHTVAGNSLNAETIISITEESFIDTAITFTNLYTSSRTVLLIVSDVDNNELERHQIYLNSGESESVVIERYYNKRGITLIAKTLLPGEIEWEGIYYTQNNKIVLSEDIFIPLEVVFKKNEAEKSPIYLSKEMTEEEFMQWNPFGSSEIIKSVSTDEVVSAVYTEENLSFDGRVGYYFEHTNEKLVLHYKPAIESFIELRHSYIPAINVAENNDVQIHKAFVSCIVEGATAKQVEKLMSKATTEIDIVRLKTLYGIHSGKFKTSLKDFIGYSRRDTQTKVIKPFDFLNDTAMDIY